MFEHIILFSSSYRTKRRIGWHYASEYISKDIINYIFEKTSEIILEPKYAVHRLTTNSPEWKSVIELDSFFEDIHIFTDLEEFLLEMKKDSQITALDVSKFLLSLKSMTNLKLQKMIYLVYAEYLEKTGKKLFKDDIIAFKYGPVVPSVYEYYKDNGRNNIQVDKDEEIFAQEITLPMVLARFLQSLDEKNVINSIQSTFKKYGHLTASELVTITHRKGTPWDHTNINNIITDDNILKYHHVEK